MSGKHDWWRNFGDLGEARVEAGSTLLATSVFGRCRERCQQTETGAGIGECRTEEVALRLCEWLWDCEAESPDVPCLYV